MIILYVLEISNKEKSMATKIIKPKPKELRKGFQTGIKRIFEKRTFGPINSYLKVCRTTTIEDRNDTNLDNVGNKIWKRLFGELGDIVANYVEFDSVWKKGSCKKSLSTTNFKLDAFMDIEVKYFNFSGRKHPYIEKKLSSNINEYLLDFFAMMQIFCFETNRKKQLFIFAKIWFSLGNLSLFKVATVSSCAYVLQTKLKTFVFDAGKELFSNPIDSSSSRCVLKQCMQLAIDIFEMYEAQFQWPLVKVDDIHPFGSNHVYQIKFPRLILSKKKRAKMNAWKFEIIQLD